MLGQLCVLEVSGVHSGMQAADLCRDRLEALTPARAQSLWVLYVPGCGGDTLGSPVSAMVLRSPRLRS